MFRRRWGAAVVLAALLLLPFGAFAADGTILIPTSQKLDTETITGGGNTVERQRLQIAGSAFAEIARVMNTAPTGSEYGLVTRIAGTAVVSQGAPTLVTTDPYTDRKGGRITTATTTTVLAGVSAKKVYIHELYICLERTGTPGNITIQDSASTNLVGTSVTYDINAGGCLSFKPAKNTYALVPTGTANGLQIVTSSAGPYNYWAGLRQE